METAGVTAAAHRLPLAAGWSLWKWLLVRGAGFPARHVVKLAAPAASAAADAVERESDAAALARLERAFRDDDERVERVLRTVAADPLFREALTWQNRHALETGVDRLLAAKIGTRNTTIRRREQLVASYLQRYCVKNDTIGFFGPVGWGEASTAVEHVEVGSGAALLSRRTVCFEQWTIDAIARAMSANPALRNQLAPRLVPGVLLVDTTLRYGLDRTTTIDPVLARLLASCDGATPAWALAAALVADTSVELDTIDEVYELLEDLEAKGVLRWTLEVPASLEAPEATLERMLRAIADPPIRERALADLAKLCAARDAVADATGNPEQLSAALLAVEATFVELSGDAATRRAGETYAGRTIVYEDCVRDVSLTLGASVLQTLGPVLALLGQSARWFTSEVASRYRAALRERYVALAGTDTSLGYARFFADVSSLFPADESAQGGLVGDVTAEVQRRWSEILRFDAASRRIDWSCAEIAAAVASQFAAAAPGWPGARHLAPDIMISARGTDAVRRGELGIVIGEVHVGNTMLALALVRQWTGADGALVIATEDDIGTGRVMPVETQDRVTRADSRSWSVRDFDVELGRSPSWKPREQILRVENLTVELAGDSLAVVDGPSQRRFDIIAFLEQYLGFIASDFHPWPRGDHTPRMTIGGVVVSREQWRFPAAQLPFATLARGPAQFRAARSWARKHELPRWVFARIPEERKPVFVDFDSPIYVELLATMVRRSSRVTLTEMVPSIDETWLPDAAGQTYTSELRLVLVDPEAWRL